MILVLDTNVWLDWYHFKDPLTCDLIESRVVQHFEIVTNDACFNELLTVLRYPHLVGEETNDERVKKRIEEVAKIVETEEQSSARFWCEDPDDAKFLDLSHQARASHLLTKDWDLLKRKNRRALHPNTISFEIMTPERFSKRLKS
jgi:putative PIN family toxin of toxin-antitoxin system